VEKDEMQKMDKAKTQDVDWLQSSFICIRKDLWDNIGGFNEKYFLFMADAEICLESWKRKKKVQFFSDVEVLADGIRCSGGGLSRHNCCTPEMRRASSLLGSNTARRARISAATTPSCAPRPCWRSIL
jgi:hypothetical protein